MLDVILREIAFRYREGFAIENLSLTFPRNAHTAITGPPACGTSTLLRLIAGTLRPDSGDVIIGQRRVNDMKAAHRPLLYATAALDVSSRWSVEHALVAAARSRSLDRVDRRREIDLAAARWRLEILLTRRIATLSSTETVRVHLARIELLRPAVLIADRLLDGVSSGSQQPLADEFFRMLRVHGTTVISAPATRRELAFTDSIAVLDDGRLVQSGSAAEVFARPASEASAIATGEFDLVPLTIHGTTATSAIGEWEVPSPPFQGSGVALVRPSDFSAVAPGEESDLIFGVEEAGFTEGRWVARGMLSGGVVLRVELAPEINLHKGRLLALRYDPSRFRLLPRDPTALRMSVPTDVVPPMSETR